ncbi:MAG TPA: T9SS type A sorting domain-containing protein [Bacteroidales bacterium]|nr:T9SS type A sorting domain-containing protein [Bacteroidales bacterium]HPS16824.1 T9SS type A sorting domain-containing protein [Bacteroidales bacterium]
MELLYKKILKVQLLFVLFGINFSTTLAQVTPYPVSPYLINTNYVNTNAVITHPEAIIAPSNSSSTVAISGSSVVLFKSGTEVDLNPGFSTELSGNGNFIAEIDNEINFILIAPEPATAILNGMVHINKWEKFEIGFKLPSEYTNAVDNFFTYYNAQTNSTSSAPSGTSLLNPYADDSLNVEINLISPDNRQIKKWGFFMRMADFNVNTSASDNGQYQLGTDNSNILSPYNWRFRFAPDYEGAWTFSVKISAPYLNSTFPTYIFNNFSFYCDPPLATNHGFLKKSAANPTGSLQFDDGTPFFGIGENLADIMHANTSTSFYNTSESHWYEFLKRDYDNYSAAFDEMYSAGANYTRILMLKSNFAVEWQNLGVYDKYDTYNRSCSPCDNDQSPGPHPDPNPYITDMSHGNRQYNLWALDNLIDKAHNEGIYIELQTDPGPPMVVYQDWMWGDNAYAYYTYDKNNNFRTDIIKYFSDNTLRYYWKRRYKYIMSRYGYSVNIAALETFGEVDQILGYNNNSITQSSGDCCGNIQTWTEIPTLKTWITDWHNDILGYIKNTVMYNANKHLTMAGFTDNATYIHDNITSLGEQQNYYQLFSNSFIDIVDIHHYVNSKDMFSNSFNLSTGFVHSPSITTGLNIIDKPFHFGEFTTFGNIDLGGTYNYFNNYDVSFHNELWATTFMGNYTTGLTWGWNTVHWWPDSNPLTLKYTKPNETVETISLNNGLGQTNIVPHPEGFNISFTNKKIYHNFKPLSNYIQNTGINFSLDYTPKYFYDESQNIECYYLVSPDKTTAYGWVHNLNHYWYNNYYYYFVNDGNDSHYLNLSGGDLPSANLTVELPGFTMSPLGNPYCYYVSFFPTRMGTSSNLPDNGYLSCDHIPTIDMGPLVSGYFGNDTTNADFAFKISKVACDIRNNNAISNNVYNINNTFFTKNIINESSNNSFIVNIFPNPTNGIASISPSDKSKIFSIEVTNVLGQIIYSVNDLNDKIQIDLTNQSKGVYLVKIIIDSKIEKIEKLIYQ